MASSPALKTVLERPRTSVAMLYSLSWSTSPEKSFSPIYRSTRDSRGDLASAPATHSNSARSASVGRPFGIRGITTTQGEIFKHNSMLKPDDTSTAHLWQRSSFHRESLHLRGGCRSTERRAAAGKSGFFEHDCLRARWVIVQVNRPEPPANFGLVPGAGHVLRRQNDRPTQTQVQYLEISALNDLIG